MIAVAVISDADELTQIMRQSKAHWGYSPEQLKAWESELLISPGHITQYIVFKLMVGQNIAGFYSLLPKTETIIWLENLFITPDLIGHGHGGKLLLHAIEESQNRGFKEIRLEADPNATYFYLRKGFHIIGQQATSIPGRFMPIMSKPLS